MHETEKELSSAEYQIVFRLIKSRFCTAMIVRECNDLAVSGDLV